MRKLRAMPAAVVLSSLCCCMVYNLSVYVLCITVKFLESNPLKSKLLVGGLALVDGGSDPINVDPISPQPMYMMV